MNNWKQSFDAAFAYEYDEISKDWIKDFIQSLLDKQREELREWVYTQSIGLNRTEIFNVFLDDLLTKLEKK